MDHTALLKIDINCLIFFFWTANSRGNAKDIFTCLVNIYGTKEVFVNEYRNMLAERLLTITDYNTDKEVCFVLYFKIEIIFCELEEFNINFLRFF
jgi:hypothetical protein